MHCLSWTPPQGRTSYMDPVHSVQSGRKQNGKHLSHDVYLIVPVDTCKIPANPLKPYPAKGTL